MEELLKTDEVIDTETKTEEVKDEKPVVETPTPSLNDVLALLKAAGAENLMALEPVKDLVETARKQEKDKLYKTIEQKENAAKELQAKYEAAQKVVEETATQNLSFEEKLAAQMEALRKEHEALVASLQQEKEQAEKDAREAKLEAYKTKKLRAAGDEIIPELVGGNSEEEIDASVELAIAKYQEIAGKFAAQQKVEKQAAVKASTKVTNPSSSSVAPLTAEEISKMSPEEYAKNRDRILAAMRSGAIQ